MSFLTRRSNKVAPCVEEVLPSAPPPTFGLGIVCGVAPPVDPHVGESEVLQAEAVIAHARAQELVGENTNLAARVAEAVARLEALEQEQTTLQADVNARIDALAESKKALEAAEEVRAETRAVEKAALQAELPKLEARYDQLRNECDDAQTKVGHLNAALSNSPYAQTISPYPPYVLRAAKIVREHRVSTWNLVRETRDLVKELKVVKEKLELARRGVREAEEAISRLQAQDRPGFY